MPRDLSALEVVESLHERMHLTLKKEATKPLSKNLHRQQMRFDLWRAELNLERPHEALGMKAPATRYTPSPRTMPSRLPRFEYPADFKVRKVMRGGRFRWPGRHLILAGAPIVDENVGYTRSTTSSGRSTSGLFFSASSTSPGSRRAS